MTNSYPSGSPSIPDSMPSGAPGILPPRRSSYASVVSGTAPQSYHQPARSGAFSHLLSYHSEYTYDPAYQNPSGQRYDPRTFDMEFGTSGGVGQGRSGSSGRNRYLPSHSSAFTALVNEDGHGGVADQFFVPSYLKDSTHVQNLQATYKAKLLAHKDGGSAPPSHPGSLSTSGSSMNLHTKMHASHRGMTYDLIEKAPLVNDEVLSPLPSRWSAVDKNAALEVLSDGQEVKLTGQKADRERDHEACAVRADHPMPPQCGIYYFEVTIISRKREESSIGIGFSSKNVPLSRLPGWEPESWAYHGDDGKSFSSQSTGKVYGPPFSGNDVIGCGVNFRNGTAFFTKNGDHLGTAFRDVRGKKLFPSVGMKKAGEHIRVNFGQSPFSFDIDGMMARERAIIQHDVETISTAKLAHPLTETELIQSLVIQFLTHEGYVETARSFANEVQAEKQALTLDPNTIIQGFDVKEDEDAGHRQRIRAAVLEGDIEKALKYTNAYYPHVLKDNENVYFRLRCRRFVEMIRQGAEMHRILYPKKSNGHNEDWYNDVVNQDMEMDDHPPSNGSYDKMDTEEPRGNLLEYNQLLQDTMIYGQNLHAEFRDDPRREVGKALNDAYALLAYPDPFSVKEVRHLLDISGRVAVAEELNSAILLSLGKSSSAALEQLIQQTTVLLEDLREDGGPAAHVNILDYTQPSRSRSHSTVNGI